ncbi:putative F-box/FBD/LRR-repeat protein At3g49030 [Triticum dicoccoides]|uniref:putative F-box/FBD/LRR-repeat protein At3g49030 n=1 Tax=Triticum dicoccoides TaxID=85692 RepID=UPI00188EA39D|nr:putative F-box/FBD/LRR-repeat protein At3g49030 [Triticum dicoccoides]
MGKGNKDDRLSALPDDILVNILDRLNVRDAARTSVLSRRWSQLCAKLSRLIISALDFLPKDVSRSSANISDDELVRINAAVVQATKSVLARRSPGEHTIGLLSMTFHLIDDIPISAIGHAVGHAMATHLVKNAKFCVRTRKDDDEELVIWARRFMLFFHASQVAFGGLTSLNIGNLRFGESDISSILTTCKRLKRMHLYNCDSGDSSTLQVEHANLSELCIVYCGLEQVKLNWLPQLTSIVFDGWIDFQDPLVLGHVPLLESVSLTNVALSFNKMVKLSRFLGSASPRVLKLGFRSEKIWVQPECPTQDLASVFRQLRFVNLVKLPEGYDLTWTMFILEAAPLLKELYMTVWDDLCSMEMDEEKRKKQLYSENKGVEWGLAAADFHHHSLVTLVIFGFESEDYAVDYVRCVMVAAVNLEDVFLYSRLELECGNCQDKKPTRFAWTKRQKISLKKRITAGIESFAIIHSNKTIRADHKAKMLYPKCTHLDTTSG